MFDKYEVPNIFGTIDPGYISGESILNVSVPGSKSITNRALLLAALAEGDTELSGILLSDDSRVFIKCLQDLGIKVTVNEASHTCLVQGTGGKLPSEGRVNVGSAGTAARFITAMLGMSEGEYLLDSSDQMKRRPMGPLLDALRGQGCSIDCLGEEGHFPFVIKHETNSNSTTGTNSVVSSSALPTARDIFVNIDDSSQFLSALLMSAVLSDNDVNIHVCGSHGMAYIDMTVKMMEQFGVHVDISAFDPKSVTAQLNKSVSSYSDVDKNQYHTTYTVSAGRHYSGNSYPIEPDMSAAAYFYAMSPLLGVTVCVNGTSFDSLQGDVEFIRTLEKTGCKAAQSNTGIVLNPPSDGVFCGIDVDMSSFSDQAITLAAIAPYADSPTSIRGIAHIRKQESDRLSGIITELGKMGIKTDETADSVTIYPGTPRPALINTYDDHRMAMGFSLTGLRTDGIVIDNPGCCAKTFENYFDVLNDVTGRLASLS